MTPLVSELQSDVFVAAVGALAEIDSVRRGVDVVATDAVEGRLPPLPFKPAVIAAVVVQPEPEEEQAHKRAENDRAGGEIEHAPSKRSLAGAVKSQSKGSRGTTIHTKAEWGGEPRRGANDRESGSPKALRTRRVLCDLCGLL